MVLLSIYVNFGIILTNLCLTIKTFFQTFKIKKKILQNSFGKGNTWENSFLENKIIYKMYLHDVNELIFTFTWKFINGIFVILPILLIIAYSTLLE